MEPTSLKNMFALDFTISKASLNTRQWAPEGIHLACFRLPHTRQDCVYVCSCTTHIAFQSRRSLPYEFGNTGRDSCSSNTFNGNSPCYSYGRITTCNLYPTMECSESGCVWMWCWKEPSDMEGEVGGCRTALCPTPEEKLCQIYANSTAGKPAAVWPCSWLVSKQKSPIRKSVNAAADGKVWGPGIVHASFYKASIIQFLSLISYDKGIFLLAY